MSGSVLLRHVEVRSWPERTDVLVLDAERAVVLAEYALDDPPEGHETSPLFDPTAPWAVRARHALRSLERDQERLVLHFAVDPSFEVRLAPAPEPRRSFEAILRESGLDLQQVEIPHLPEAVAQLYEISPERHWELVADWFDRCERRYPAGVSRQDERSWVQRAHPARADHFTHLAGGDQELAFEIFAEQVDVETEELSLYQVLCWSYFLRTEFAGRSPVTITALEDVGIRLPSPTA